jgi:hypothetical protein
MDQQCYRKTTKGNQEIAERSGFLSSTARRLLIRLDGKRTRGELLKAMSLDELEESLARLELLKMVEEVSGLNQAGLAGIDKQALAQVYKMMFMSNQQYLAGKLDRFLEEDFALIQNRAGLETVLEHWHKLLCDAGHEVTAYAYLKQINAALGWNNKIPSL